MTGPAVQLAELATLPPVADALAVEEPDDLLRYVGLPSLADARALVDHARRLDELDHVQVAVLELVEAVHAQAAGDQAGVQRHLHQLRGAARSWSIAARPGGVR